MITRGSLVRVQPALPELTNESTNLLSFGLVRQKSPAEPDDFWSKGWAITLPIQTKVGVHFCLTRGISSAGRAPALQAGGRRFDPVILHHRHHSGKSKRKSIAQAMGFRFDLLEVKAVSFFNNPEEVKIDVDRRPYANTGADRLGSNQVSTNKTATLYFLSS